MSIFSLSHFTLSDGTELDLAPGSVLCVVGGNNVGKSLFLREITGHLQRHLWPQRQIVNELSFAMGLNDETSGPWLRVNGIQQTTAGQEEVFTPVNGGSGTSVTNFMGTVANIQQIGLGQLMNFFVRVLDSHQRAELAITNMQVGSGALYLVYRDGSLEQKLSNLCKSVFGFPLTLDRSNGTVMLRVGKPIVPVPSLQHPTKEYADDVLSLRPLAEQGDGVRNYMSMALHMLTASEPVTIIDEPEAFLHPAQARVLGGYLGKEVKARELQLITATHDRDFVLGLLGSGALVTFFRLNRVGDATTATVLPAAEVNKLWSRPVLRYSNILQGLFHKAVAVCEADADCRWYAAVLDSVMEDSSRSSEEALFVPSGGKDQIPSSVAALRRLGVPAFAMLDFDSLLDQDFMEKMLKTFDVADEQLLKTLKSINSQLSTSEQHKAAKSSGLNGLPLGDVTRMATELLESLKGHNILVVPVGELESFDRRIGGHAAIWVTQALKRNLHKTNGAAREYVTPLATAITV